jgi:hypothetical protein
MVDLAVLAFGLVVFAGAAALVWSDVSAARRKGIETLLRSDAVLRQQSQALRKAAKESLEQRRERVLLEGRAQEMRHQIREAEIRLDHPDLVRSWVLVIGERRSTASDVPYVGTIRDTRDGARQRVLVWDSDRHRVRGRLQRRFPAAEGFEVEEVAVQTGGMPRSI